MAKIIIPQSNISLGNDPNCKIEVRVDIRLVWKNKIVRSDVENLRGQLQLAFNDQARLIEKDLVEMISNKKSPGFIEEGK